MAIKFSNPLKKGGSEPAAVATELDTASVEAAPVAPGAGSVIRVEQTYTSNRGRRIMAVVLILLIILLLLATVFLYNMVQPKGNIADGSGGKGVEWVRSIYGIGPSPDQQFFAPASVDVRENGDIIVPNVGMNQVSALVFNASGVFTDVFAGSEPSPIQFPTFIEVAPDGKIYILQRNTDEVLVLSPDGRETLATYRVEEPTSIDVTEDRIAIGARAGWVVTDLEFNPLVGPVGTNGKGEGQYDGVTGIAIDEDNNIYTVDTYNNRLSRFTENGDQVYVVELGAPSNSADNTSGVGHTPVTDADAALAMPTGAEFDSAGRLLLVDTLGFTIAAFNPEDGAFLGKWGEAGKAEGEFLYPSSIAYDPIRDWVVITDTNNNRVQIVRVPGTGGGAGGAIARALAGPLRACIIPLILLLIAIALWIYWKWREKRKNERAEKLARERAEAIRAGVAAGLPTSAPESVSAGSDAAVSPAGAAGTDGDVGGSL